MGRRSLGHAKGSEKSDLLSAGVGSHDADTTRFSTAAEGSSTGYARPSRSNTALPASGARGMLRYGDTRVGMESTGRY